MEGVPPAAAEAVRRYLSALRGDLLDQLTLVRAGAVIASTELQRSSYRTIAERLKAEGKLLLVHNSTPSALLVDLEWLNRLCEEAEDGLTVFERLLTYSGKDLTAEEFQELLERSRPGGENA